MHAKLLFRFPFYDFPMISSWLKWLLAPKLNPRPVINTCENRDMDNYCLDLRCMTFRWFLHELNDYWFIASRANTFANEERTNHSLKNDKLWMSDSALPLQHFRYDINCDATFPTHHFRYSIFATAISVQHFRYKIFNTAFPIHHFRYRISGTTPSRERVQCSIFDARCRIPHFQNIIFGSTVGSSISATPFGNSIFERTF